MTQHDVHKDLNKFYDEHVRLGKTRRNMLAERRDACLARLREGLDLLGQERGMTYRSYLRTVNQGSYAMHTLNQHPQGEYDLDAAVIFAANDLPTTALAARQRIADALLAAGGNFRSDPEARTNAVTVWYADGTHVDLAIYREVQGLWGTKLEHAGADWSPRDPGAVTDWFEQRVGSSSPSLFATVDKGQLRRIVRWIKAFARSRPSWNLPGGMILTALAAEVYVSDHHRDDVALHKTLTAMSARLRANLDIVNPADASSSLTSKAATRATVNSLAKRLDKGLEWLAVLDEPGCTRERAFRAWGKFFHHEFWGAIADCEAVDAVQKAGRRDMWLEVGVARSETSSPAPYEQMRAIPKKHMIRFRVPAEWRNVPNAKYRWIVKNTGDEAAADNCLEYELMGGTECWRETAYRGVHTMTCQVLQNDRVVAEGVRQVLIGRS